MPALMHLLELAAQNVRGCSPTTRAALGPGYMAVVPPGADAVPLGGLALALFYADGRGGDAAFVAPSATGGKAALSFLGRDQNTYRVVRQLGGAGMLQRLDKATGALVEISRDAQGITGYLRANAGLPQRTTFEQLFVLSASQLPSRRPVAAEAAGSDPAPGLSGQRKVSAASDVGQAEAKLRELEKELELSKQIDALQFRQDGLASEMFALEEQLRGADALRAALKDAEAAWAAAPTPESAGLPKDILSRAERYPTLIQKRDEALERLEAERAAEAEAAAAANIEPLYRDPRFVAGVAAGALFLGAGIFLEGSLRYLALLDIPAFGFSALVALKWVDDLQSVQRVGRKEGMLAAREKKLREDFDAEAQHVRQAMTVLGVETPQEIIDVLARRALLHEKVEDYRQQLKAADSTPAFAAAASRHQALKRESEELSAKLQRLSGGYVRDPREVEREIDRVTQAIAAAGAAAQRGPSPAAAPGPGAKLEDPAPALLALAAELAQSDVAAMAAQVKDRCAQYLAAFTDRRWQALELDAHGAVTAVAPDRRVPAAELPPRDADALFVALRLTLVEKLSASSRLPLIIEDGLGFLEAPKQPLLGRMLKHLGTLTQVVHVAPPAPAQAQADAIVAV
jgi:hypothetical protein